MTHDEEQRFTVLQSGQCVPVAYVRDYYGLQWPFEGDLLHDYETWAGRLKRRAPCPADSAPRYELEGFLQQQRVLSKKWMGARLGMTVASLDQLLAHLRDIGLPPQRYVVYPDLISEALSEDLVPNLRGLRFRTFSDHNSFCERLHAELAPLIGGEVERLFCATSDRIQDYPRQFASNFDCITLAPVSGKHQMWLDFRKPLSLAPDRCSKLLYAENHDALLPYRAGRQEPDDLGVYHQFLAEQAHG
jgi:hypothetical protein